MKNLKISLRDKAGHFIANNKSYTTIIIALLFVLSFTKSDAQYISSTSTQNMYPTTGTSALNLDKRDTKYLSNFSFPGTGVLSGETIELAGWSTDNNGGFSYGRALSTFPYTYTGDGALAIPDARDVQIGFMVHGSDQYIVAAYYDVNIQLYAYDLYTYAFTPPSTVSVSKLYTYHFQDPDHILPGYIPCTDYAPAFPPSSMGVYSRPVMTTTMGYNRISMDINKDGNKVVMVMTNNDNGYLYLAAGQIGANLINFSPNLPTPGVHPAATSGAPTEMPAPHFPYTGAAPWVPNTPYDEYFDGGPGGSGYYVRYYHTGPMTGEYHYSYYPLSTGIYVTVYDGTTVTSRTTTSVGLYNPLIGIKGCSYTTGPAGDNAYFNYYWPDVAFSGEYIRIVFYVNNPMTGDDGLGNLNGAEDLYVTPAINSFSDYYTYTGQSSFGPPSSGFKYAGPNHMEVACVNSFDGRPLRATPTTFLLATYGFESQCKSLPLVPGEEIRAKIDAPDLSSSESAITFAYSGVPSTDYIVDYYEEIGGFPSYMYSETIHYSSEFGKKNIYARYQDFGSQAILTNGSIATGHTAINTLKNIAPAVSFAPSSTSEIAVAWVSEDAGVSTPWSYIGVQLDVSAIYGGTGYLLSSGDYLRIPNNPTLANDCGDNPLVSLSKHDFGLSNLYTCFTQEDATPTYSVQHQDHVWSSPSTWRIADPNPYVKLQVGPNPFSNTLHVSSSEAVSVSLMDITGKQLMNYSGSADLVNRQLDNRVMGLSPGNYLLNATTVSGHKEVFKVTKQ